MDKPTNNPPFAELIRDVTPLGKHAEQRIRKKKNTHATPYNQTARRHSATSNTSTNATAVATEKQLMPEDSILYAAPGLDQANLRKLRKGTLRPSYWLDLHGDTVAQAQWRVDNALQQALTQQHRCLLIIHGKGGRKIERFIDPKKPILNDTPPLQAVLKNHVNRWLRQHDKVLGFCSAKPQDGGTGAVYVLLKKAKAQPYPAKAVCSHRPTRSMGITH